MLLNTRISKNVLVFVVHININIVLWLHLTVYNIDNYIHMYVLWILAPQYINHKEGFVHVAYTNAATLYETLHPMCLVRRVQPSQYAGNQRSVLSVTNLDLPSDM